MKPTSITRRNSKTRGSKRKITDNETLALAKQFQHLSLKPTSISRRKSKTRGSNGKITDNETLALAKQLQRLSLKPTSSPKRNIGILPENIINKINEIVNKNKTFELEKKKLSHMLHHARVMRAIKGLRLVPYTPGPYMPRTFYDPKHHASVTNTDFANRNIMKKIFSGYYHTMPNMKRNSSRMPSFEDPQNEESREKLKKLRKRAAEAASKSKRKVTQNTIDWYKMHCRQGVNPYTMSLYPKGCGPLGPQGFHTV